MVIISSGIISFFSLYFGYELTLQGAKGEFAISSELEGMQGYIASLSPGIGFGLFGCVIALGSYWIQTFNWGPTPFEITGSDELIERAHKTFDETIS